MAPYSSAYAPFPSPACAGEGCRRRGVGRPSQGLRPGLQSSAPDGAEKRIPSRADFMNELTLHDTGDHKAFVSFLENWISWRLGGKPLAPERRQNSATALDAFVRKLPAHRLP